MQNNIDIDTHPHRLYPSGRETCLNCPRPEGCIFEVDGIVSCDLLPQDRQASLEIKLIEIAPHLPASITEISRQVGVTRKTLYNWKGNGYLTSNGRLIEGVNLPKEK